MNLSAGIARNKLLGSIDFEKTFHTQLSDLVTCFEVERIPEDRTDSSCFGTEITAWSLLEETLKVHTLADLGAVPVSKLSGKVSVKRATELQEFGRGIDHRPVVKKALQKTILVERSFSPINFRKIS